VKKLLIPRIHRPKIKRPEPGSRPGTIAQRVDLPPPTINRIEYNSDEILSNSVSLEEIEAAFRTNSSRVVWLDVTGIGDIDVLRQIGANLNLDPLTLEDIAHVHQRPKLEEFEGHVFMTLRAIRVQESGDIDNEQLSFVLSGNLLVTFQERPGDGFEPIRRRLRDGKGPLRRNGADYLFYALLDVTLDNYFPVLELYGDSMDKLDEQIRVNPTPGLSRTVHTLRRELRQLRRAVWPLRDVAGALSRNEIAGINPSLKASFRDCHDHAVNVVEFVEGSRERVSDLGDLYQAMVSERTNQIMKTLTMVSTVFIPLTFLSGLYGMNFDNDISPYNMPELRWRYGYFILLGAMLLISASMFWVFKRRGWLGADRSVDEQHT
jgi:magnesium transporter